MKLIFWILKLALALYLYLMAADAANARIQAIEGGGVFFRTRYISRGMPRSFDVELRKFKGDGGYESILFARFTGGNGEKCSEDLHVQIVHLPKHMLVLFSDVRPSDEGKYKIELTPKWTESHINGSLGFQLIVEKKYSREVTDNPPCPGHSKTIAEAPVCLMLLVICALTALILPRLL